MKQSVKDAVKEYMPEVLLRARRDAKAAFEYRKYKSLPPSSYPDALSKWFKSNTGEMLDLKNPISFNQKIQWLKLYDSTPEKGMLADKYLVRDWIASQLDDKYLVPLLGVWDDPDEIDFDSLPDSFACKATHGCGWNLLVEDKLSFNENAARVKLKRWLRTDYSFVSGFELHYSYCVPRVIIENYLGSEQKSSLIDYKVHVFNAGSPIVLVCKDRDASSGIKKSYYDEKWRQLDLAEGSCERFACPKPTRFEEMLENSLRLAKGLAFVRVDWYEVDGELFFGEMTFTPASGIKRFVPDKWNEEFGSRIDLTLLPRWREMEDGYGPLACR